MSAPTGFSRRIVITYAALFVALEAVILFLTQFHLASELREGVLRRGGALAATLSDAVAAAMKEDPAAVRRVLEGARRSHEKVGYAFVVDAAGRPVANTFASGIPPELQGRGGPGPAPAKAVEPVTVSGAHFYDIAAPVASGRLGRLHLGITVAKVEAAAAHTRGELLLFAGVVLAFGGIASVALARNLTRPLRELCDVAARVREGDLAARASESGPAESVALAQAWNEVTATLARRIDEVHALERYQARLLETMGDAIRVIGPDRRVEYANARARADSGFPDSPAEQVLATGKPAFRRHEAPDGTVLELAAIPLERPDGTRSVIERCRDVTEFVNLTRRLVHVERMALLGEVAAGVAHEIGNPLDGMRICLDVARESRADPARAEKFHALIAGGIDRIEAIVRRLAEYARPLPLRKQEASLNDVVEQALLLLSVRIERRGVALERRLARDLPPVDVDAGALSQVIVNLVLNALDAIEAKGAVPGTVVVETLAGGGERPAAGVRVSDDGIGIAPEVKEKVGTAFFTTKPPGKGTGLGLSVSRGLVEQHGGRIEICGQPGEGAAFTVWIPVAGAACESA